MGRGTVKRRSACFDTNIVENHKKGVDASQIGDVVCSGMSLLARLPSRRTMVQSVTFNLLDPFGTNGAACWGLVLALGSSDTDTRRGCWPGGEARRHSFRTLAAASVRM